MSDVESNTRQIYLTQREEGEIRTGTSTFAFPIFFPRNWELKEIRDIRAKEALLLVTIGGSMRKGLKEEGGSSGDKGDLM